MKRSAGAGWTVTRVMGETPLYPKPRRGVRGEGAVQSTGCSVSVVRGPEQLLVQSKRFFELLLPS